MGQVVYFVFADAVAQIVWSGDELVYARDVDHDVVLFVGEESLDCFVGA